MQLSLLNIQSIEDHFTLIIPIANQLRLSNQYKRQRFQSPLERLIPIRSAFTPRDAQRALHGRTHEIFNRDVQPTEARFLLGRSGDEAKPLAFYSHQLLPRTSYPHETLALEGMNPLLLSDQNGEFADAHALCNRTRAQNTTPFRRGFVTINIDGRTTKRIPRSAKASLERGEPYLVLADQFLLFFYRLVALACPLISLPPPILRGSEIAFSKMQERRERREDVVLYNISFGVH